MAYSRFECKVTASLFIIWGILLLSTPVDCFAVSRKQRGLFSRAPFPRALRKTRFPTLFTLESTDTGTRVYAALSDSSNGDKPLFTQVISDVDDTLKSSGGVNVAGVALGGIDVQYPRGEMYPGVAEFMLQMSLGVASSPTVSNPALAVFLHVVADKIGSVTVPPPKIINGRPVIFFRTYVGAAVAAVQLGFMSMDGLDSVIAASCQRLADVPRESDKWADLERDIARAQATFVF
jgi:hypothetical protein